MKRIQRKRTKGWKMPKNTVYVGRPTYWGNPYKVSELSFDNKFPVNNEQAVAFYKQYLMSKVDYGVHRRKWARHELKGKNLACWCKLNEPCHADILLKIANK